MRFASLPFRRFERLSKFIRLCNSDAYLRIDRCTAAVSLLIGQPWPLYPYGVPVEICGNPTLTAFGFTGGVGDCQRFAGNTMLLRRSRAE